MTDASNAFHEPVELLNPQTLEARRGILSLVEEFEAIAWYDQRIAATEDAQLKAILTHNRDEEKEHAIMALEWLRRRDPALDNEMRAHLFTDGDIAAGDESESAAGEEQKGAAGEQQKGAPPDVADPPAGGGSLGIGSLRAGG